MKDKNLKRTSTVNLIAAYITSLLFILIVFLFIPEKTPLDILPEKIASEENKTQEELVYVDRVINKTPDIFYKDHLDGVIVDDQTIHTSTVRGTDIVYSNVDPSIIQKKPETINELQIYNRDSNRIIDHDIAVDGIGLTDTHVDAHRGFSNNRNHGSRVNGHRNDLVTLEDATRDSLAVDRTLLDRRLREIEDDNAIGLDTKDDLDLGNLAVVTDSDNMELGEVSDFNKIDTSTGGGYGTSKGGQLYAYNFPTKGIGAGVGSGGLGAGGGAGAGLGAGIGEGVLNGEVVPTLGGVGTYMAPGKGSEATLGQGGGVGGLVGGAGAGGAAGLYTGQAKEMLGVGPGAGLGSGSGGGKRGYNYDHLPKDGALHIMMHVDGSGSILNTRKQLDIMKETILKDALLPYYNDDENLYNNRVTIVSSSGERTLKFFAEAAKKKNVLAIAFQDEAQPAYHLPNFNKKPEDHYVDDIGKLKSSLNGYNGVYRGVMFQVDRGKTFAKSFKEFVGNAFQGKGYLESNNLKKYYRDNNLNHIKNKDGIVFSDEYHAKDSGDPQYYLELIFNASKKIGLDLQIHKAGLTDGKYIKK